MTQDLEWHSDEMFLYSETRYNLTIRANGEVLGVQNDEDPDCRLKICPVEPGFVRIRGFENHLYLCFGDDGQLFGTSESDQEGTVFEEHFQGSYTGYRSRTFPDWFIGIKKTGAAKNGKKTAWGQKAVKFLPRRRHF